MNKYRYLPMVVPNLDFDKVGWTRKHREIDSYLRTYFGDKDYVLPDPKDNWFLDYGYSELAVWKDSAKYGPKLLPKDSGLAQGTAYAEILRNIEKLKGQVK